MTTGEWVLMGGVALACLGGAMLVWCMIRAFRLRANEAENDRAEQELQTLLTLNMAGVVLGFLGIGIVITGLLIG
ncbi:MAG: hypothetical protein AAFR17_12595 [Pseudomonadota bacterium]